MRTMVTGGGGFLGKALVQQLHRRGDAIRVLARADYPELRAMGVETIQGDIRDPSAVARACSGMDVVFHVASKAGVWGDPAEFRTINVDGTRHVLDGCRAAGVPTLVYTSTPSVVHGGQNVEGGDERLPYPTKHHGPYPETKAEAEQRVREASSPNLRTIALRPHLVWGPEDPHFLPRLSARAQAGRLRQLGNDNPLVDSTCVENAALAHVLAAERLHAGAPLGGNAYFITNGEPIGCWTLINALLDAIGAPPVRGHLPVWLATGAAHALETTWHLLGITREPPLTPFLVQQLTTAHWFKIDAARRDLGYEPIVTLQEGFERLRAWANETGAYRQSDPGGRVPHA